MVVLVVVVVCGVWAQGKAGQGMRAHLLWRTSPPDSRCREGVTMSAGRAQGRASLLWDPITNMPLYMHPTACNATHNTIFSARGGHLHLTARILTRSPVLGADGES
jgi:hypothetical protein